MAVAEEKVSLEALKKMAYEDARKELMKLCGIGKKVADCICLFALHHVEAFPIDTHIAQILTAHYPDGFPFCSIRDLQEFCSSICFIMICVEKAE